MTEQKPPESIPPLLKPDQLLVKDMYVVSMPSPGENNIIKPWPGMESLFAAEECARFTFVMTPEQVAALPPIVHQLAGQHLDEYRQHRHRDIPVRIEKGPRAYSRLLKLALGLEDMKDDYTRPNQLYVRPEWERYKQSQPENAKKFDTIMKWFSRDFKRINSETEFLTMPKPTPELSVKKWLNLQGGENVLLVADKLAITESSAKAIAQASVPPDTITLTHPDAKELAERLKEVKKLQKDKLINGDIKIVTMPFHEAVQHDQMEKFSHVVVCMPIGKNKDDDIALFNAWKDRERKDGLLIHRKGNPIERGEMTDPWNQQSHDLIGPGELEARRQETIHANEATCEEVRRLCVRSGANRVAESLALEQLQKNPERGKFTRALALRQPDTRGKNPGNASAGTTVRQ
jgi:hypothetical protein